MKHGFQELLESWIRKKWKYLQSNRWYHSSCQVVRRKRKGMIMAVRDIDYDPPRLAFTSTRHQTGRGISKAACQRIILTKKRLWERMQLPPWKIASIGPRPTQMACLQRKQKAVTQPSDTWLVSTQSIHLELHARRRTILSSLPRVDRVYQKESKILTISAESASRPLPIPLSKETGVKLDDLIR